MNIFRKSARKIMVSISFSVLSFYSYSQSWSLVWSDEFNGSSISSANWKFETGAGGWGNNELEYYTNRPENATVGNGNLMIIAKKESYNGSNYTSARMKTQGLKSWTYGKIEARMKLPVGKGIWPAFWMLGDNITQVGWPKCGEIDIMEHVNTETLNHGTIHWDNNGHAQYGGNTSCIVTDYHIYSIEWDSNAIKWFVDGVKYVEANIASNINSTEEFHTPFFIILNMAVGGNWPGPPDGSTVFPDTMFVDYVKVSQLATSVEIKPEKKFDARIFPNPSGSGNTLHLQYVKSGEYKINVLDVLGQVCFQKILTIKGEEELTIPLPVDRFTQGMYTVFIENESQSLCLKFIKN